MLCTQRSKKRARFKVGTIMETKGCLPTVAIRLGCGVVLRSMESAGIGGRLLRGFRQDGRVLSLKPLDRAGQSGLQRRELQVGNETKQLAGRKAF